MAQSCLEGKASSNGAKSPGCTYDINLLHVQEILSKNPLSSSDGNPNSFLFYHAEYRCAYGAEC